MIAETRSTKPQNVRHLLTVSQIQMRMEAHSLLAACKIKERDSLPWWAFVRYSLMTNEAERLEARASECMAILGRG